MEAASNEFVDITGFSRGGDATVTAKEDPDETEYSSSFGDTNSGHENNSGMSDAEVESPLFGNSDLMPPFDGFSSAFPMRKKKLTAHWRSYIRPLMWRCKWAELRMKELESLASRYTRDIAAHEGKNRMLSGQMEVEQSGSRSLPYTYGSNRNKPMKRRKRRRVENVTDVVSYISNHNLFSDRESKRSDMDGTLVLDDISNPDPNTNENDEYEIGDNYLFLEDNDNRLEHILRKLELVQSRVHKMKSQLDSVMMKNAGKFSSYENLSQLVPCDAQGSSIPSPNFSACNEDTIGGLYMPTEPISEIGDFILHPDSEVSSFGMAIDIPDIIESTVGLLSSVDVTPHHAQVGDSSENILDNILAAEIDELAFSNNVSQSADKPQDAENTDDEESNNAVHPALNPDFAVKTLLSNEQSILKSCLSSEIHFPKNKRKRGERKAGTSNWGRQRPGEPEPDSQ